MLAPRRLANIAARKNEFQTGGPDSEAPARSATGEARGPVDVLRILLVSASPIRGAKLRVDEEFAQILAALRRCTNLRIEQRTAVSFDRLRTALLDVRPHVLHVSSHGTPGVLYFQGEGDGPYQQMTTDAFITLLGIDHDLRLVVLNACDSFQMAEAVVANQRARVAWTIGMHEPVRDKDAIAYSVSLYDTLAEGQSLQAAHYAAIARLQIDPREEGTPAAEIPRLVPDDFDRADKVLLIRPRARQARRGPRISSPAAATNSQNSVSRVYIKAYVYRVRRVYAFVAGAILVWLNLSGLTLYPVVTDSALFASIVTTIVCLGAGALDALASQNAKNTLVFWRLKNPLPSTRAFEPTSLAADPRISIEDLRALLGGEFPVDPQEQSSIWYGFFKMTEHMPEVEGVHREFLTYRDLALCTTVLVGPALFSLAVNSGHWLELIGYILIAILFTLMWIAAAREKSCRLVQTVLAITSARAH